MLEYDLSIIQTKLQVVDIGTYSVCVCRASAQALMRPIYSANLAHTQLASSTRMTFLFGGPRTRGESRRARGQNRAVEARTRDPRRSARSLRWRTSGRGREKPLI